MRVKFSRREASLSEMGTAVAADTDEGPRGRGPVRHRERWSRSKPSARPSGHRVPRPYRCRCPAGSPGQPDLATSTHPGAWLDSGSVGGSREPEAPGVSRLRASCEQLGGGSRSAPAVSDLQRSGHDAAVAPSGVKQQHATMPRPDSVAARASCPHRRQPRVAQNSRLWADCWFVAVGALSFGLPLPVGTGSLPRWDAPSASGKVGLPHETLERGWSSPRADRAGAWHAGPCLLPAARAEQGRGQRGCGVCASSEAGL